ncbi:MAG: DNA polymerase III subunit [Caldilineaceae bacterium]
MVGHEWAIRLLQHSLTSSARGPRHAYLFLGSPQVGKSTLARAFAQALLCTDSVQRPCGVCRACRLMEKGGHPDFRLVQPTDRNGATDRTNGLLRVEQAAEIIHDAMLHPVEGKYKVFLIQDVHQANDSFSNKLLKTLEEPPGYVVLILTAHDRSSLLPTIVSRCQVLELRPVDAPSIERALVERWRATPEEAALWSRLSHGRLGWAVQQLTSSGKGLGRQEQIAELRQLARSRAVERLKFSQKLAAGRNDEVLFPLLAFWVSWWRDVLLVQSGCADSCSNIDQLDALHEDARSFNAEEVRTFLHTLSRIEGYLRHTVNAGLALDVLLLQLPSPR